jgi:hypothetical protein
MLAALTVGACSQGSDSGGSSAGGKLDAAAAQQQEVDSAGGSSTRSALGPAKAGTATYPVETGAKIQTAEMLVAVVGASNVAARADAAADIAVRVGGEVDSDDRTSGAQASATMQLRVPPTELQPTLRALSKLGTEKSRQLSTTDVSEKVADVTSRVTSSREAIARLRGLYAHATKVADVIAVEGELSTREADLESLEAQQRSLARQTSTASISLTLQTAPKKAVVAAKPAKKSGGFVGGLRRGWDGFSSAAAWLAGAFGTVLPFLVLMVILGLAGRFAWTRLPHRPAPTPAPTSPE